MKKRMFLFVLLFLLVFAFFGCKSKEDQKDGTISVVVVNLANEELFNKEISFKVEDTLLGILKKEETLKLKYEEQQYGAFITSICDLAASNDDKTFWAIYVNGESSLVGISEIVLKDKDVIKFALTTW